MEFLRHPSGRPRRADATPGAGFACPDLTVFCGLDELGLEVTGQRLEPDRAVLACRVVEPDDSDEIPRSTSGCDLHGASVQVGVVVGAVLPAAPDHADPRASQDPDGMWVSLAARDWRRRIPSRPRGWCVGSRRRSR